MKYTLTIESDSAEDIRSVTEKLTGRVETETTPTAAPVATETPPVSETKTAPDATTDNGLDKIGMAYDPSIHADPPSFKSDGTWKVARGKAEQAKAAVAAFKAAGGNITPPVIEDTKADEPVSNGMPGMPGMTAGAEPELEDVDIDTVMGKWTGLMESNKLTKEKALEICIRVTGIEDAQQHFTTFQNDDTARAKLYAELKEVEAG